MKTKTLAEQATHIVEIYLQMQPPVSAVDYGRIANEIRAMIPANTGPDGYRWRFHAGPWAVSCDANWLAAQNMADKMKKRDMRNTFNRIPRAGNIKQYTAKQFDAACKRTPELENTTEY